jgi:stearoyl-CoA desaturase (delta-9 desaturase)
LKQRKIDELKNTIDFGPEVESLPIENWKSIEKRVQNGAKLIVIDGIVHDVAEFMKNHPGGMKIISDRIGKDTTIAFNGGIYRHTKAARNLAAMYRVARLPADEMDSRVQSDDIPLVDHRFT